MKEFPRTNLASRAYHEIRKGLMAGEFEPGEALKLRTLSEQLGTSQTPIREALMQLVAEHALTVEPGRSPRVPQLTRARFSELCDIRVALERLAARNAMAVAPQALLDELGAVHDRMIRAKQEGRYKDTMALNRAFHFEIYRACGQETLISLIEQLWVQTGPFLNFLYRGRPVSLDGRHPHEHILDALAAGDADRLATAMEEDIIKGGAPILDSLAEIEAPQDRGHSA
ncbi:GntR family transcriptional regulator [Paralimibaculum aggregatum]|uniref:GntR family transcriptional regulator n=1 Tax=Paralimibaculum aggregatum TaxID=3036245 RepID=A0ABQ6LJG5_9RHOB|nr:GntR family transcriptional regulator [Limibaculum sp. NKW23]GMG82385.1 GntR family transcriptional regulator [Limibaculum sp. NKW23]